MPERTERTLSFAVIWLLRAVQELQKVFGWIMLGEIMDFVRYVGEPCPMCGEVEGHAPECSWDGKVVNHD